MSASTPTQPHAAYLPGASVQHPGLRVKFTRSNILQQFPDQFKPYLLLGCDLQSEYKGTLFRFPLRTSAAANQSEIKKEAYPIEEVLQRASLLTDAESGAEDGKPTYALARFYEAQCSQLEP